MDTNRIKWLIKISRDTRSGCFFVCAASGGGKSFDGLAVIAYVSLPEIRAQPENNNDRRGRFPSDMINWSHCGVLHLHSDRSRSNRLANEMALEEPHLYTVCNEEGVGQVAKHPSRIPRDSPEIFVSRGWTGAEYFQIEIYFPWWSTHSDLLTPQDLVFLNVMELKLPPS